MDPWILTLSLDEYKNSRGGVIVFLMDILVDERANHFTRVSCLQTLAVIKFWTVYWTQASYILYIFSF